MNRITLWLHERSGVEERMARRLMRLAAPRDVGPADVYLLAALRSEPAECNPFEAFARTGGLVGPYVEIRLNLRLDWPFHQEHDAKALRMGYLPWGWLHGPDELLLCCFAHELRHVWQAQRGRALCDTDADRWALSRLERYRRAA